MPGAARARTAGRRTRNSTSARRSRIQAEQPDALLQLAELTHELGNDMQARAFLQRYLAVAPATAPTLLLGYRIERALGDQRPGGRLCEAAAQRFPDRRRKPVALQQEPGGKP